MDWNETQGQIFRLVAENISTRFPKKLSIAPFSQASADDIRELKDKQLIVWDFGMKALPFMMSVSNPEHQITLVVYYGDAEVGYCCIGCALGCVNEEGTALEVSFMEKRCDADSDLDQRFLTIVVDAFSTYGLYLNQRPSFNINKFALVGPVEGVKRYYMEEGFELVQNYSGLNVEAMVKFT